MAPSSVRRGARLPHRRPSPVVLTAALSALAVLVAGGCSNDPGATSQAGTGPSAGAASASASRPTAVDAEVRAPRATRWVGRGRVTVAVPVGWRTTTRTCEEPRGPVVAVAGAVPEIDFVDCASRPTTGVESLAVEDAGDLAGRLGRGLDLGAEVAGLRVVHSGTTCRRRPVRECRLSFVVGRAGFTVVRRGPGAADEAWAVLRSLRPLTADEAVVPWIGLGTPVDGAVGRLEDAGLRGVRPDVGWPHDAIGTEPAAGSVVARGSEVAVLPGDG